MFKHHTSHIARISTGCNDVTRLNVLVARSHGTNTA